MTELPYLQTVALNTLRGDLRDAILGELRGNALRSRAYADLSETEQVGVVTRVNDVAADLVRQAVDLVASGNAAHLDATFATYTAGPKGMKITLTAPSTDETRILGSGLVGHSVVVVSADAMAAMGERAPVKIVPDQTPLPFSAPRGPDMEAVNAFINGGDLDANSDLVSPWDDQPDPLVNEGAIPTPDVPRARGRRRSA